MFIPNSPHPITPATERIEIKTHFLCSPGIDEEEAEELEPLPVPPPPTKGGLPQDFQDALSIIFDKGVEKSAESAGDAAAVETGGVPVAPEAADSISMTIGQEADSISTFAPMDMDSQSQPELQHIDPNEMASAPAMELDEQSQYMLYGSMTDKPLVFNDTDSNTVATATAAALTKNIPTPPIQIIDAAGNLTQISGAMLELDNDFVVLDANGQPAETGTATDGAIATITESPAINASQTLKKQRLHELDDLAMLGIDAEDVCI